MAAEIRPQLRQILVELLGLDEAEITADAEVVDDLGADSLDVIELVMSCEETFRIEIGDDQAERCRTVGDLEQLIGRQLAAKA